MTPAAAIELLETYLAVEDIGPDTDLVAEAALDSLGFMTLFELLEDLHGITVALDDLDLARFRTPACIAAFVRARTDER